MNEVKRVPVLMYHRIGKANNDWEARYAVSPRNFKAQMVALAKKGLRAVTADALMNWLEKGITLPNRAFLITFDDGFRGVYDHAMPVLKELNWPFTVFLVSDLIGAHDEWTRSSNPAGIAYPLLNIDDIKNMQQHGACFQSHTRTHPSLPTLDNEQLVDQLSVSRASLTKLLGHEVEYIAYPFGHLDERVKAATQAAGYRAGFSTQPGFNRKDVDPFRIRRIDVFGTDTPAMLMRKIKLGSNDGSLAHEARYYLNQLKMRLSGA
jgi:peptidoglycan/xylan/chitin deacetylase (PgdA/CDA1 family)